MVYCCSLHSKKTMAYRKDKSIDAYCPESATPTHAPVNQTRYPTAPQKLAAYRQARLSDGTSSLENRVIELQTSLKQANSRSHRYHELFTLAPIAYISLDSHARIQMVNLAATCLLDSSRSDLTNKTFFSFVKPSDRLLVRNHMENASFSNVSTNTALTLTLPGEKTLSVILAITVLRSQNTSENTYQIMLIDNSHNRKNEKLWRNAKDYMEELALHDPLTKLPNRYKFNDSLNQAIASSASNNSTLAVIYFDLDGFKPINDLQGHATGDAVLCEVASRLVEILGTRDNVARIGGDEFTVTIENVQSAAEIQFIGQALADSISQPIAFDGNEVSVTTSMGICFFPDNASTADQLVNRADKAMYQAKQSGGNQMVVYTQDAFSKSERLEYMMSELSQAISRGQFDLVYQPIHNVSTERSTLVEALLRWRHPTLGNISPSDFIPMAEQSDFICDIGNWVLNKACKQIQQWRSIGMEIAVAINVSTRQLIKPDFVSEVQSSLDKYQLPCHLLEIEITETAMMTEAATCCETIQALADKGHTISMDDFGTGHSSLARLALLPVQRLKIDRSFIREIQSSASSRSVIKAIMSMARDLQLDVIAEGIENNAQKQFLCEIGCTLLQGYLMSSPQKPASALDYIEQLNRMRSQSSCQAPKQAPIE